VFFIDPFYKLVAHTSILDELFEFLNNFHERLTFTIEFEKNLTLKFLDLTIIKRDHFICKHYQKPTHTGRMIHYFSNQPYNVKLSTARQLKRSWISSSNLIFHHEILCKFKDTLRKNVYPVTFINQLISSEVCIPPFPSPPRILWIDLDIFRFLL